MKIGLAKENDVLEILTIFNQAKEYFKRMGIDQWQGEYPNVKTILLDIALKQCYLAKENDVLLAVIVISLESEFVYEKQLTGSWHTEKPYSVIHRLATNKLYPAQGLSTKLLTFAEQLSLEKGCQGIRIDTHERNDGMRYVLTKTGYRYVGELRLLDGSPRVAYDKNLLD